MQPSFASWTDREKREALREMYQTIQGMLAAPGIPYFWPAPGRRPADVWAEIEPTLSGFQRQMMAPLVEMLKSIHGHSWQAQYTGGDDPTGMDCSGAASCIDRSVGLLGHRERWSSQRFWDEWSPHFLVDEGQELSLGDHLIYGKRAEDGSVTAWHVDIAISPYYLVGAHGGARGVDTLLEAEYANAFFQKRKIGYRTHDYIGALRPLRLSAPYGIGAKD